MRAVKNLLIPVFTLREERLLLSIAIFGLLVPNGIFIGYALTQTTAFFELSKNPLVLTFMFEAFFLMFFFAWLIEKNGGSKKDSVLFILLSLVGSLFFSIPFALYFASQKQKTAELKKIASLAGD